MHPIRFVVTLLGAGLLMLVVSMLGTQATAQELPPRPVPTATTAPVPTATSAPAPTATATTTEEDESEPKPTAVPPGRITGTVINQITGAPAAGLWVYVDGRPVQSDAAGNYLRDGLAPGRYTVWLALPGPGQTDPPVEVVVQTGATTVQHLRFAPGSGR